MEWSFIKLAITALFRAEVSRVILDPVIFVGETSDMRGEKPQRTGSWRTSAPLKKPSAATEDNMGFKLHGESPQNFSAAPD